MGKNAEKGEYEKKKSFKVLLCAYTGPKRSFIHQTSNGENITHDPC